MPYNGLALWHQQLTYDVPALRRTKNSTDKTTKQYIASV
jgi:hypothetical protein